MVNDSQITEGRLREHHKSSKGASLWLWQSWGRISRPATAGTLTGTRWPYGKGKLMTTYSISERRLSPEDVAFYAAANAYRDLTPTGELLEVHNPEARAGIVSKAKVVFTGKKTGYDTVRDCGGHYIIALYDRFDRIDKATMQVTKDVPDR